MMVVVIVLGVLFLISAPVLFILCVYCCTGSRRVPDGDPQSPTLKKDDDPELGPTKHGYRNGEKVPASKIIPTHQLPAATSIPTGVMKKLKSSRPRDIPYEELEKATNGFCDANVLGEGGFGKVYKGVINDEVVAVKKLKAGSGQGDDEFQAEIEFISRVHHRHLVALIGFCILGENRLLVYEFVPNNSLRVHLHGKGRPNMEWSKRRRIAIGSGKGLEYLHEHCKPRIIHRDIKSDNILLDDNFEPKVADFGLAKFFPDAVTHVSTVAKGTPGYVDPDYFNTHKLSDKSDVFSYGVVLLELITGRRHVDGNINIVLWAVPRIDQALHSGNYEALVDVKLQKAYDFMEMTRMIFCAAACVHESPQHRPQISQVVRALEGTMSAEYIWKRHRSWAPNAAAPNYTTVSATNLDYDDNSSQANVGCGTWPVQFLFSNTY